MYDRPSQTELIHAAIQHFEEKILPLTRESNHQLYFQTLVAVNVLRVAEREIANRPAHLRAEWARLSEVLGDDMPDIIDDDLGEAVQEATTLLCERIRKGDFDENEALFQHLVARTIEQLEVANPKFLQTLNDEDEVR